MLKSIRYVNNKGGELVLSESPYDWLSPISLFDYAWGYEQTVKVSGRGSTINRFTMEAREIPIVLDVRGDVKAGLNDLLAITEPDVLSNTPGRLYFGDQYTTGYLISSTKPGLLEPYLTQLNLVFLTDIPAWVSEDIIVLPTYSGNTTEGFTFPFHFPVTFMASLGAIRLLNDHYAPTPAVIKLYGPTEDPQIAVNSHIYKVNGALNDFERFEIDQRNKKVWKITQSGERINAFAHRGKIYSVFEPIPSGESIVFHNGTFAAEIKLLKERSEPQWN